MAKARRRCRPGPKSWQEDPRKCFDVLLRAREAHDRWLRKLASRALYSGHGICVAFHPRPSPAAEELHAS